jgi:hypothetical protein
MTSETYQKSAARRLVARWNDLGLTVRRGCGPHEIDAFEARVGLRLPTDLREFLAVANGVERDSDGFSFWPLEMYETFEAQLMRHSPGSPFVAEPHEYYVFCDYLDWSWAYAIRLNGPHVLGAINEVVPVGMMRMHVVASSFSQFVDLYLEDSPLLYPR